MEYWINIKDQKPEKDEPIFYLDNKTVEYYRKNKFDYPANDDIDKGIYVKDNLVEWHYDYEPEEFVYWFPIPKFKEDL